MDTSCTTGYVSDIYCIYTALVFENKITKEKTVICSSILLESFMQEVIGRQNIHLVEIKKYEIKNPNEFEKLLDENSFSVRNFEGTGHKIYALRVDAFQKVIASYCKKDR